MSEEGRPSVTPFSISDILNREHSSQNSNSIWDSRYTYERPILPVSFLAPPQYMQTTSPCLPTLPQSSACTRYPCSQQPVVSPQTALSDRRLEESPASHRSDSRSKSDGECVIFLFVVQFQTVGGLEALNAECVVCKTPLN